LYWPTPLKGGYLVDLTQYDVDLEAPHLDRGIMDLVTISDKVYGLASGTSPLFCQACYFNKRLITYAGYDPEELYKWQDEGTWTWEKFKEVAVKVSSLSQGDNRIWGTIQNNCLLLDNLVISNETDYIRKTADSVVFSAGDPKVAETIDFLIDLYELGCFPLETSFTEPQMFYAGIVGFCFDYLERLQWQEYYPGMTDDYGVLMIPKGPQANDYRSMVNWFGTSGVLKNAKDPDKLALLLYALMYPVDTGTDWEVVYESYVRDERSLAVFDLITSRRVFTPQYMGTDARSDFIYRMLPQILTGAVTFASFVEEMEPAYNYFLEETWLIN